MLVRFTTERLLKRVRGKASKQKATENEMKAPVGWTIKNGSTIKTK